MITKQFKLILYLLFVSFSLLAGSVNHNYDTFYILVRDAMAIPEINSQDDWTI